MKKRVAYFYDPAIGTFHYSSAHPMKPLRVRMTHTLVSQYGLLRHLSVYRPCIASYENLTAFHTPAYIEFLKSVMPGESDFSKLAMFNLGEDCPVFEGLYDFCKSSAGGSLSAAYKLNSGYEIAINWSGGLHHAKKAEASGFCYVNDIVLAILELLKYHPRVLYIDIDVHHGDGVEEAFYTTDRVATISFHKYGDYFPGTGAITDTGIGLGAGTSVNVPLRDGISDAAYTTLFKSVVAMVIDKFRPSAVVLQCGADSLAGDRLGCFNLTHVGHSECVRFVKSFNLPLIILGGGGYTIKNVSRVWALETAVAVGQDIQKELPFNEFYEHYAPDYTIDVQKTNCIDKNDDDYLNAIIYKISQNLQDISAPSTPLNCIPPSFITEESDDETVWERYKMECSALGDFEENSDEGI